ncbi:MAG TPA: VCBS repeat-containing protein [Candidatus Sulfotelmatobacter sp.]
MNRQKCGFASSFIRVVKSAVLVAILLAAIAFAQNPVPQIAGPVQPMAVAPGSAAFTLTVYGANFVPGAVVNWNGQPRTTSFISARELQAQILASDVAKPTAAVITAINPGPGGGHSSSSYAQIEVHTPTAGIVLNRPTTYFVDPWGIIPAAINGNGVLDFLGFAVEGTAIFAGNGNGTFTEQVTLGPLGYGIGGVGYGDFNHDGIEDVVYVSGNPSLPFDQAQLTVMLGDGNGQYHLGSTFGAYAYSLVVGDFNGDGRLDIAALDGSLNIYLGNGDGTFQQNQSFAFGGGSVFAGDFNGDGKLDLVVESPNILSSKGVLALLVGNGDGTFQLPVVVPGSVRTQGCQTDMLVSDFNGDGNLDLAFCNANQIAVVLGKGDGTFKKPVYVGAGYDGAYSIAAGDFNSDGKIDLVSSHVSFDYQFWTMLGNGDGTFQPKQTMKHLPGAYTGEIGVLTGDFNSDGLLDLLLQPGLGDPVVYLQQRQ